MKYKQTNKQTSLDPACTRDKSKLLVKSVYETAPKSLVWAPTRVFQDLSTCHDWPVNKAIINLPIRLKGNLKRISSNSLSPLAQNKDIGTASQKLLNGVRWRLWRMRSYTGKFRYHTSTVFSIKTWQALALKGIFCVNAYATVFAEVADRTVICGWTKRNTKMKNISVKNNKFLRLTEIHLALRMTSQF